MSGCTARAATWRTGLRSSNWLCLPTAPRARSGGRTSTGCCWPPWPTPCSKRCAAPRYAAPSLPGRNAMPHPAPSAAQDRRRGHPKYPHRGGAPVQRLPRPGRVPAPGASADRRIASLRASASTTTTSNPDPERRVALRITRTAQEAPKYPCAPLPTDPPGLQPPHHSSKMLHKGPNRPSENKIAPFVQHAG